MIRLIVRVLLTAVLFRYVFPKIANGVHVSGGLANCIIYAAVFSLLAYVFVLLLRLTVNTFSVITDGMSHLISAPVLILGFWLIPALQLEVFAHFFPQQISVASWGSAIWAGLFVMIVNTVTSSELSKSSS